MIYNFCELHGINYKNTGKIIIAQNDKEFKKLKTEKMVKNGLNNLKSFLKMNYWN